jgi:hypothetical protein
MKLEKNTIYLNQLVTTAVRLILLFLKLAQVINLTRKFIRTHFKTTISSNYWRNYLPALTELWQPIIHEVDLEGLLEVCGTQV